MVSLPLLVKTPFPLTALPTTSTMKNPSDKVLWFSAGFLACMLLIAVYDIGKNGLFDSSVSQTTSQE
jgi:hypothetical protein